MKAILESWNRYLTESSFYRTKDMIDKEHQPFLIISASRDDLQQNEMGNQKRGMALKRDLKASGYPFTQVFGAGQEEPVIDPKTGDSIIKKVLEVTQIVTTHQRGDVPRPKSNDEVKDLFELGKKMATKYKQFAFIFGYPEKDARGDNVMVIAAYEKDAPSFGLEHNIKEPWAGPWHTIRQAIEGDQYWTKIAGVKGVFVEDKIRELEKMKTKHYVQKGWKRSQLLKWKSLL
jgi:hypothetical protein